MAVYYLNYDHISRADGQSAVAAAAYRATAKIVDASGKVHNYTRKTRAVYTAMLHSPDAPDWTNDRGEFWRQVEAKENRSNSEFAKSIILALPKELTTKDGKVSKNMVDLVEAWARKEFVDYGLVADIAIHAPSVKGGKSNGNWHAHVLVSTRAIGKDGWNDHKDRRLSGGSRAKHLEAARADWANIVNAEFARCGINERISEKKAVSKEELEEALSKDEKYQSLLKKKAQLEAQLKQPAPQPKPSAVQKLTSKPASAPVKASPAPVSKPTQTQAPSPQPKPVQTVTKPSKPAVAQKPASKPMPQPVQKAKTAEQIELEKQTAIVNGYTLDQWQTVLYGNAETRGSLKAYQKSVWADAKAMYIENNVKTITDVVNPADATAKHELAEHLKAKPSEVVKKGNIFMMYRDDNGNKYTRYEDYADAQKKLLSNWNGERKAKAATVNNMTAIVNAGNRKDWHRLAELIDKYLPELAKTIKAGAQKLIQTAKEFAHYRAYYTAVKARQTHENALQRVQNANLDKEHGERGNS